MKARILPPDEWSRLERTQIPMLPGVKPADIDVVVVEDEGKVVACLSVLKITHFEGLWIDPERGNGLGAPKALLRLALALTEKCGSDWVWAGAADDRMRGILSRVGAVKLPVDSYVLNFRSEPCRQQQ